VLEKKLKIYAESDLNVLLIGSHGIGKSTIVKEIIDKMGYKYKYFSSSTLDPYASLIGIPVPDKERRTVDFFRPSDLEDSEFVFFDELNRAHPRVLNAVLEIIQFKSINGIPLPKLRMVWAAINPPGEDYQVEELDPALVDRFHVYIKMKAIINKAYLASKMGKDVADLVSDWWQEDLSKEQRQALTPRRLEYIGSMISKNIPWVDALPQGYTFDRKSLENRIKIMKNEEGYFIYNKANILAYKAKVLKSLQKDKRPLPKIVETMKHFKPNEVFECRDIVELMPKELLERLAGSKWPAVLSQTLSFYKDENLLEKYPKTVEAFSKTKSKDVEV